MWETHIIGHAYGNNDITKNPPNIPYLQGDVIKIMENEVVRYFICQCSYVYAGITHPGVLYGKPDCQASKSVAKHRVAVDADDCHH